MDANKPTPPADSLDAIAESWDAHSLADYWDQTEQAEFEFDPQMRLIDEDKPGLMPLDEYAELYNIPLDADAYRREFPEDEPCTHPPTDDK